MTQTTKEILNAKKSAGGDAYLWMQPLGTGAEAADVILWPNEEVSVNDDGAHAIGRWTVDQATKEELYGECDVN